MTGDSQEPKRCTHCGRLWSTHGARLTDFLCLQPVAADWHARRFPKAKAGHVALKAQSELGELADALLGDDEDRRDEEPATGDVLGEAADVVICLLALIGRWYPGADLLGAVEAKLLVLVDENGTHRSSLGAMTS
jgi:hypothetical protein